MNDLNYDDPQVEEVWCLEQREEVSAYLLREHISHGQIGEWPAWHLAPYASVWAIESATEPDTIGWWVISGDLPKDYLSGSSAKTPRIAVRMICQRWQEHAEYMERGIPCPGISIGTPDEWPVLAPLLISRANLLLQWTEDDSIPWGDDDL